MNSVPPPFYLFLDFDGVLHRATGESILIDHFEYAERLGFAIALFPEVQVVISSSWREVHRLDELREFCGPILGRRIVDVTPVFRRQRDPNKPRLRLRTGGHAPLWKRAIDTARPWYERFEEISTWLDLCAPAPSHPRPQAIDRQDWLAIDDMPQLFPPDCPQLILVTDGGLEDMHFEQIEDRLSAHRDRQATR